MYEQLKAGLENVAFTLTTPFTNDGAAIASGKMRENLEFLEQNDVELYVPCGNTGEYYSLTDEERVESVQITAETVSDGSMVLAGAGGSTGHVIDLAHQYEAVGASAVMIMHPGHTHIHEQGLVAYYRKIMEAIDLPIVIYKRGPELSRKVLVKLSADEGVIGIKYASSDITEFTAMVQRADSDVVWINGLAERYAPAFALEGATGFTTGIGNFLPKQSLELFSAIESSDWSRATAIRNELSALEEIRDGTGSGNQLGSANNVPVVKYGMEIADLYGGPVREPLSPLDSEAANQVENNYDAITSNQ